MKSVSPGTSSITSPPFDSRSPPAACAVSTDDARLMVLPSDDQTPCCCCAIASSAAALACNASSIQSDGTRSRPLTSSATFPAPPFPAYTCRVSALCPTTPGTDPHNFNASASSSSSFATEPPTMTQPAWHPFSSNPAAALAPTPNGCPSTPSSTFSPSSWTASTPTRICSGAGSPFTAWSIWSAAARAVEACFLGRRSAGTVAIKARGARSEERTTR
mmetsp:Transcript_48352/g.114654  ORF Transcript_48352/g.114654 Transcript_48352/m.114654 type:complete len:218 (+) Transcript_48352:353-1006(+)